MGKKHTFPLNIFMLFHVEFHVGFLSVDIRHSVSYTHLTLPTTPYV